MKLTFQSGTDGLILTATETGVPPGRRIIHTHIYASPEVIQALNTNDRASLRHNVLAWEVRTLLVRDALVDKHPAFMRRQDDPVLRGMREIVERLFKT